MRLVSPTRRTALVAAAVTAAAGAAMAFSTLGDGPAAAWQRLGGQINAS
jgi:hypothetical protein